MGVVYIVPLVGPLALNVLCVPAIFFDGVVHFDVLPYHPVVALAASFVDVLALALNGAIFNRWDHFRVLLVWLKFLFVLLGLIVFLLRSDHR